MKRTQLTILILLVIVLGVGAWLLMARRTASWQYNAGQLPDRVVSLSINEVAQITITQPEAKVDLARKGDTWVLAERSDYPANYEMINTLIRKVWELKPVQQVKVGPSQLGRLDLLQPGQGVNSGTLVDFKDAAGKRLAAVLFGKKYMRESDQPVAAARSFPAGRYVMPVGDSPAASLVTDPFAQVDNKAERWLDRDFIKIEKPISISCIGLTPVMNWKLERANASAPWSLVESKPGEELDATKANQVASAVGNLSSFADVLPPDAKPETTGLDKPLTFTVTTEEGFTYVIEVGKETGDNYPAKIAVTANLGPAPTPAQKGKSNTKLEPGKETEVSREELEKKLAKEKRFEARSYLLSKFGLAQLEKNRSDLLTSKAAPTPSVPPMNRPHK